MNRIHLRSRRLPSIRSLYTNNPPSLSLSAWLISISLSLSASQTNCWILEPCRQGSLSDNSTQGFSVRNTTPLDTRCIRYHVPQEWNPFPKPSITFLSPPIYQQPSFSVSHLTHQHQPTVERMPDSSLDLGAMSQKESFRYSRSSTRVARIFGSNTTQSDTRCLRRHAQRWIEFLSKHVDYLSIFLPPHTNELHPHHKTCYKICWISRPCHKNNHLHNFTQALVWLGFSISNTATSDTRHIQRHAQSWTETLSEPVDCLSTLLHNKSATSAHRRAHGRAIAGFQDIVAKCSTQFYSSTRVVHLPTPHPIEYSVHWPSRPAIIRITLRSRPLPPHPPSLPSSKSSTSTLAHRRAHAIEVAGSESLVARGASTSFHSRTYLVQFPRPRSVRCSVRYSVRYPAHWLSRAAIIWNPLRSRRLPLRPSLHHIPSIIPNHQYQPIAESIPQISLALEIVSQEKSFI